jgi:hypothetical protein
MVIRRAFLWLAGLMTGPQAAPRRIQLMPARRLGNAEKIARTIETAAFSEDTTTGQPVFFDNVADDLIAGAAMLRSYAANDRQGYEDGYSDGESSGYFDWIHAFEDIIGVDVEGPTDAAEKWNAMVTAARAERDAARAALQKIADEKPRAGDLVDEIVHRMQETARVALRAARTEKGEANVGSPE